MRRSFLQTATVLGQIIYGPVSDMVGRKVSLYFGIALFGLGSVGCALADDDSSS